MDDRMPSIVFASSLLSTPYIILAVVATAVIIAIGAVFVLRSGKGKNATGTGAPGNSDWQRQGQPGAPNMPGAWNQQQQGAPNAWGQQAPTQQAAGGWNAPNTNNWPGMQQQQQQPAENPWAAQQQQAATVNPWNQQQQQQQPAANPWGQQQQSQPAANPWSQQQQSQPAANPWSQQQQQSQPAANPWGQQQQQPQSGAGWGDASATPAPTGQQGSPSWPGTPNMAAQSSYSGNSNPGWGQQPGADAWSNQAPSQANAYAQQGTPGSLAPSWQQQGGMGSNPNLNGNDATALYTDNDKTMLRSSGAAAAGSVGMVRVEQGKEPGRIYEIRKESLSIGRSRESDIFLEDLAVSRLHASIVNLGNGNYALKDEGSANGTKVNGQLVNKFQTYPLQEGDQIQLGQTVLVFGRK